MIIGDLGTFQAVNIIILQILGLFIFSWVLFGQKLQHLVVQTDVIFLKITIRFVFLEVNVETGELFESFCVPSWRTLPMLELLLH